MEMSSLKDHKTYASTADVLRGRYRKPNTKPKIDVDEYQLAQAILGYERALKASVKVEGMIKGSIEGFNSAVSFGMQNRVAIANAIFRTMYSPSEELFTKLGTCAAVLRMINEYDAYNDDHNGIEKGGLGE
jgi:ribosomal protein L28